MKFDYVADNGATPPTLPPGDVGVEYASVSNAVYTFAPGFKYLIDSATGPTTITGGDPSGVIVTGGGNYTYTGSASIIANGGSGAIVLPSSDGQTVTVDGNTTVFAGSTDHATIQSNSGASQIIAGNNSVVISLGDDTIVGGTGAETIATVGQSVIIGPTGNAIIATGGPDTQTILQGAGDATVFGSGGGNIINGSAANLLVVAGSGAETVFGGTGDLVVFGSTAGDQVNFGSGSNVYVATAGSSTVSANQFENGVSPPFPDGGAVFLNAGSNLTYTGKGVGFLALGGGSETLNASGSAAGDVIQPGAGNETISGSSGGFDTYNFFHVPNTTDSTYLVTNYQATDLLQAINYGMQSGQQDPHAQLQAHITQNQAGTVITLGDGSVINLQGYTGSTNNMFAFN